MTVVGFLALAVVGLTPAFLAGWLDPGLTSIGIPHVEMARSAVELLVGGPFGRSGAEPSAPAATSWVRMPLHERGSVGPPSRRRKAPVARLRSTGTRP